MARHFRLVVFLAVFTLFACTAATQAQSRILVCESPGQACRQPGAQFDQTWSFNGTDGVISSLTGTRLTIDRLDNEAFVVRRSDSNGLSATYTGKVHGTTIDGEVEYTWPGQAGYPRRGYFAAQMQDQLGAAAVSEPTTASVVQNVPNELLVCENSSGCNGAWLLNGNTGKGTWFERKPVYANLTVLNFSADDVRIRRSNDTGGGSALYTGELRGGRYEGVIVWSSPGHPGDRTGHWTATLPQTHCNRTAAPNVEQAMSMAVTGLMFGRGQDALGCYEIAGEQGDARAQMAAGLLYYQGRPDVSQNYGRALYWLRKAADQGVYNAQRTVAEMFKAGQGTSRDPAMAEIYTARADEQRHDFERAQESRERAADRQAQIVSSFVLGASFGLFF